MHIIPNRNTSSALILSALLALLPLVTDASVINVPMNPLTLNQGLAAWWTFDGKDTNWGVGMTNDVSRNGNTGYLSGLSTTTSTTAGKTGQALLFNGSTSYVKTTGSQGSNLNGLGQMTISVWIKPNSIGGNSAGRVVSKDGSVAAGSYYLSLQTDAGATNGCTSASTNALIFVKINAEISDTYASRCADNAVTYNQWQLVTMTWDGTAGYSGVHIYKNGAELSYQGGKASVGSAASDANLLEYIGNRPDLSRGFDGQIDDVRIYSRVLSAAEIRQLYSLGSGSRLAVSQAGANALAQGLVGWWTFDGRNTDWNNNQTYDSSVSNNTGTLKGMSTTSSPAAGKIGQALNFNGSSSYISTAQRNIGTGDVTTCVWAYVPSNLVTISTIIGNGDYSMWASVVNDPAEKVGVSSNGGNSAAYSNTHSLRVNAWNHICAARRTTGVPNGPVSFFVNGAAQGTGNSGNPTSTYANKEYIGQDSLGNFYFVGKLDDVRVYNRILSAGEIKQLYSLGR